jgi:biopolymer transport protein ExbB
MANGMNDCYSWQPDGCEWTIGYLWRSMSSFGRLDVIVLALMLVYLFAAGIHVCCLYYLARRKQRIDSAAAIAASRKKLAAVLNIQVGSLKSIAITAPCLGLAGTCLGILSAFGGVGMEKYTALAMIATRIAVALIPTAVGIPVAVLAACSHNYLCTRLDLLEGAVFKEGQERGRHFPRARRFPRTERFAELPAFGLLGALPTFGLLVALGLTVLIKVYMPFPSLHRPVGFYVELASARCEYDGDDRLIVLHITDTGKLFLNLEQEDWNNLANRLSQIYSMREHRTLYLVADSDVPFRTVAEALDTIENASATQTGQAVGMSKDQLDIQVQLLTPKAFNADCLLKPVVTGSTH